MKIGSIKSAVFLILASLMTTPLLAASYYPVRLNDPTAVYLTPDKFPVHGDGIADDSAAIQQAIDQVEATTKQGIVFIPSGRYRITKTIYVWPAVRVIGYGPTRPVLVLGKNTPGFQQGIGYMVMFAGGRHPYFHRGPFPGTVPAAEVEDANPGTFYSAMSNVDFEIQDGNPAAVGIRFHVAQHCFLTHMDFHIGSGLAALKDIGNEAEDLHFYGGQYGIVTEMPSPGWQFTLLDSTFEGQSVAAIQEHEAGLTLDHDEFRNVPTAISIDPGYSDELWVKNSLFQGISGPAVIVSNENNPRTEINLHGIVCKHVPLFVQFRESGKKIAGPGEMYRVQVFSHGLTIADLDAPAKIETSFHTVPLTALPPAGTPVIRNLPPRDTWVNLHSLGAKGDGVTDDTAATQRAIDEHPNIYIPSGHYIVSDTLKLKPDTVLIGLHPSTTQFDLRDSTPRFQGVGNAKPLLETPKGGTNIVTGIGIYTNGINSRAAGVMWMAGENSLMDDVRFLGGHGTNRIDGTRVNPYNNTHTADPDIHRRWDAQYPSLWITNGGGGTFADIWTPDTYAQAGMYISNTTTPGHVYELSSEHHVRNEIVLRHVSNWEIDSLQTEEEWGEGPFALPLEIDDSSNITVANFHSYRVIASYQPFPYAVRVARSSNIQLKNLHVNSNSKVTFDNSVFDQTYDVQVRYHELASLSISGKKPEPVKPPPAPVLAEGAKLKKLWGGFFTISGAAVDTQGRLYFIDTHWQRIYRWTPETHDLKILRDNSLQPTQLAMDRAGNLMVISYAGNGTVYTFRPDALDARISLIQPVAAAARPGMTAVLPVDYWGSHDFVQKVTTPRQFQFISPDGTTFIPAGKDFIDGATNWGVKMSDVLRAFSLAKAVPGRPFYVSEESEQKTYSGSVGQDGTLSNLKLFAERGGESVIQDSKGNVYLAAGNIFIFDPSGKQIGTIDVPERPVDLIFGGKDGKTLFILTHSSLYSIQTRF
jgi:Pectate lyase superfamily protein/SMP-30/Gluconolactonase/LRE-like region